MRLVLAAMLDQGNPQREFKANLRGLFRRSFTKGRASVIGKALEVETAGHRFAVSALIERACLCHAGSPTQ